MVNGLKCNFSIESDFYNGTFTEGAITVPNVLRASLQNLNINFEVTNSPQCPGGTKNVQLAVNITDGNGLLLFISEKIFQGQIDSVHYSNFLSKPSDGGAMLFTIFDLQNYNNETFSITEKAGGLKSHLHSKRGMTEFGYLDKFEVEIKGKDIVMSVADKKIKYQLDQGATYIQYISGDLNGVNC